jgi:3D (Asp-Asp-Asp) domain-containing protein
MSNARVFLDLLLAAAALITPLFPYAASDSRASGMAAFITSSGVSRRVITAHKAVAKKPAARALETSGLTYTVTATVYNAVPGQTDDEPFVTADNSRIKPHYGTKQRWMALSQDLLRHWGGKFNYGDRVRVTGISPRLDGVYTVHDTMNRRHRHCMDVLAHPSEKLDIFQKGVKIKLVAAL